MRYLLFNIGKPYTNNWWQRHIDQSFVSVGFDNKPGDRGDKIFQSIDAGDCLLAYANMFGVVGYGVIGSHSTYRLLEDDSLPQDFESRHRHLRDADWQVYVTNLADAIPLSKLDLGFVPRQTRAEIVRDTARRIIEQLLASPNSNTNIFMSELISSQNYSEGSVQSVLVNRFERSPKARNACIEFWGISCYCCDMTFNDVYGDIGNGFIQVHHLVPISEIGEQYSIDPIADLRPVCPNCHAMLHRNPPASIESLRAIFQASSAKQ